jgi:microcompartment protein CcmK/EutM
MPQPTPSSLCLSYICQFSFVIVIFICHSVDEDSSMLLGRVIGTATSTVRHPTFHGERLLVVQLETKDGRPDGEPILVFDRLGAGRGDEVICTNDGRALQELLGPTTPGRWSVLGLPDW